MGAQSFGFWIRNAHSAVVAGLFEVWNGKVLFPRTKNQPFI
jgi:hypothetical protein